MTVNYESAMGEVIPGLWVGNLLSVSKMLQLVNENGMETNLTIISVLSNRNMIRLVSDILEQDRLRQRDADSNAIQIRHEVIQLKDVAESDLLSVLPDALMLIDDALGYRTAGNSGTDNSTNDNNQKRICLVHCAQGASRSVSIVVAYLLSRHHVSKLEDALQQVRRVRPLAEPNIGFLLALRRFERTFVS